jgi:hypothetical protein
MKYEAKIPFRERHSNYRLFDPQSGQYQHAGEKLLTFYPKFLFYVKESIIAAA